MINFGNHKHIFSINNVSKNYKNKNVLKNICINIEKGDKIAIMGKSGSGKSSLLNLIGGLDTPSKGAIYYKNININKLKNKYKYQ